MKKSRKFKLYSMVLCGIISLISILLPWISYGVGSKTGLDIGRTTVQVIFISGILFIIFSYLHFKIKRIERILLYLVFLLSFVIFSSFLIELIRIGYQITMTKNLPVEMFGVASMASSKIHIGYGLWLGVGTSLIPFIVNLIAIKITNKRSSYEK